MVPSHHYPSYPSYDGSPVLTRALLPASPPDSSPSLHNLVSFLVCPSSLVATALSLVRSRSNPPSSPPGSTVPLKSSIYIMGKDTRPVHLQQFRRSELAYLAEGILLRHGDEDAQKKWLDETFKSSADAVSGEASHGPFFLKPSKQGDGPLENLKGSAILKIIHDYYKPSQTLTRGTFYLCDKFFTERELVERWNRVFDTVIKHYDGVMPLSAQYHQLHALMDQDYECGDFHIAGMLFKSGATGFRPLPLMEGYGEDVKDLPPYNAICEMIKRRAASVGGVDLVVAVPGPNRRITANTHYHGAPQNTDKPMLRVLPELEAAKDDETLNKIQELVFRLMDEHISTVVIVGSVAITLGVLLTDFQIRNRFTPLWTSSRKEANRRGSANNLIASYKELKRLREILDNEQESPEPFNDTRHIWTTGTHPSAITDELVEDFAKGRELSIDAYQKFIERYGEVVGCSRNGCYYNRSNIKKTNITSQWFESAIAKAMDPEWNKSPPVVRCRSCARTDVFLIDRQFCAMSVNHAQYLMSGSGHANDNLSTTLSSLPCTMAMCPFGILPGTGWKLSPVGIWERLCPNCTCWVNYMVKGEWKTLAEEARAKGHRFRITDHGFTFVKCSEEGCDKQSQDYRSALQAGLRSHFVDHHLGYVNPQQQPICQDCFKMRWNGVERDEMTSAAPDYFRLRKTAGGQRVRELAEEVIREFVKQRLNSRNGLHQLILATAAKSCHTVYERPLSMRHVRNMLYASIRQMPKTAEYLIMLDALTTDEMA